MGKHKINKGPIIMYSIIYFIIVFVICKIDSYILAYPNRNFIEAFNLMMEDFPESPLYFPKAPVTAFSGILIFSLIYLLIIAYIWTKEKSNKHAKQGTEEGTAHWLTDKDPDLVKWNKHYTDPKDSPNKNGNHNMIITRDIYLSMNTRQTRRNNNVLVIGGSGAGKSRFFVKPNLCQMPLNVNFICTDPSGELLAETGSMLEGAGYKIKVFNLVNMALSDKYNPFKYIKTENDVLMLVDCILANTTDPNKKGGDDFWEKAQKLMFQAFIFFIWLHGKEFHLNNNLTSLIMLMDGCQISEDDSSQQGGLTASYFNALKTTGWYFDEKGLFHPGKPQNPQYEYHEPLQEDDIAIKQYNKFMTGAGKTLKSILISAMARLSVLDSNTITNLLTEDDIELDKLGDEKTALFVIIPQEHDSFNFLAAMLYTQLFQSLYYHAENECQGNYLVLDSAGENVKAFAINHTPKIEYEEEEAEEIEINFNKNTESNEEKKQKKGIFAKLLGNLFKSKDSKPKITAADCTDPTNFQKLEIDENNEPDENPGDIDDKDVEQEAKDFCDRAKKYVHCTKKGRKYLIKVPGKTKEDDEIIVGEYGNKIFAQQKLERIKAGCTIKRCGLSLPYHVRFMLDEFANIGQIPDFTKKLATMRKYEISSTVILQNLAQIKTMYDKDWGSVIGNCDSILFLGCPEIDTLEYISKMLGKTTLRKKSESVSHGKGGGSASYQNSGRDLMTIDELRRLGDNECIFILRGEQPYKGIKHQFIDHDNYKYTADADDNNLYTFHPKPLKTIQFKSQEQLESESRQSGTFNLFNSTSTSNPYSDIHDETNLTSSSNNTNNVNNNQKRLSMLQESKSRSNESKKEEYSKQTEMVNSTESKESHYTSTATKLIEIYKTVVPTDLFNEIAYDESSPNQVNKPNETSSMGKFSVSN